MKIAIVAAEAAEGDGGDMERPDERMTLRLMSRPALLAYFAVRRTVAATGWRDVSDVGLFMGVGASGADLTQLRNLLAASQLEGAFDLRLFGDRGLRACNPLFAFSLMNNFTSAHSAALAGIRGPNKVLFSRGIGTLAALAEAVAAIEEGACSRAIVGGADDALHPVTVIEEARRVVSNDRGWIVEGAENASQDGRPRNTRRYFAAEDNAASDSTHPRTAAGIEHRPPARRSSPDLLPPSAEATMLALAQSEDPRHFRIEDIDFRTRSFEPGTSQVLERALATDCERIVFWTPWPAVTERLASQQKDTRLFLSLEGSHCLAASPPSIWRRAMIECPASVRRLAVVTADVDGSCGALVLSRGQS